IIILLAIANMNNANAQLSVLGAPPPDVKPVEGTTLETRLPNAKNQHPAFAGQTRAVAVITKTPYEVTVVNDKLSHPWSLAFMPDGKILITEKRGTLRIVSTDGTVSDTLSGMPRVVNMADGGLLDLVLDPDFKNNRTFFFSYDEPRKSGANGIAVASARLSNYEKRVENVKVIFRVKPDEFVPAHLGSRLLFDKEGKLLVTTGERFLDNVRVQAQWLSSDLGKILRINKDGSPAAGNPTFPDSANAKKEIWSYGHRNPQGLAFNPETGDLWETEHGPQGGDEINIIKPGKNYGWPVIAYGTEYSGQPVDGGKTAQAGMEQPVYYWDPAVAPSGIAFYSGKLIPEWKNNLFVSALAGQHLIRLVIKDNKVIGEERLLIDNHQRVRDVVEGPDGALWVVTDADNGRLIRISAE
ncbi:MAG: PQQ-dependent sugar dehydrogenase, partial [Bacteroidetes bacterium]|nr:PQQ-dependent sugar dehydrogenase [Bacteroidota bacterium]